jgi:redox-sensitive bicupin YhaK (pirin superfamily)
MFIYGNDLSNLGAIIHSRVPNFGDGLYSRCALPSVDRRMVGPFVLLNHLGPRVFAAGHGFDMRPHPHIGLATVTYLVDGELIHRDSLGGIQTIRPGEVNWMTAGSGVVHSERTSAEGRASGGDFLGFQAWVALPAPHEEDSPNFTHYSALQVPKIDAYGVELILIAGRSDGLVSPAKTLLRSC